MQPSATEDEDRRLEGSDHGAESTEWRRASGKRDAIAGELNDGRPLTCGATSDLQDGHAFKTRWLLLC